MILKVTRFMWGLQFFNVVPVTNDVDRDLIVCFSYRVLPCFIFTCIRFFNVQKSFAYFFTHCVIGFV